MPDKKPISMRTITEEETGLVDPYAEAMRQSFEIKPETRAEKLYHHEQPLNEEDAVILGDEVGRSL